MSPRGLFETHLTVADLDRSVAFYRDVVGLPVALEVPDRGAAFFRSVGNITMDTSGVEAVDVNALGGADRHHRERTAMTTSTSRATDQVPT